MRPRPVLQIELPAFFDFRQFLFNLGIEIILADASGLDDILVDDDFRFIAINDRRDSEFGLEIDADLAHQNQIERRIDGPGHLQRHRYAAARQRQDHRIGIGLRLDRGGKPAAGVGAIAEQAKAVHRITPTCPGPLFIPSPLRPPHRVPFRHPSA